MIGKLAAVAPLVAILSNSIPAGAERPAQNGASLSLSALSAGAFSGIYERRAPTSRSLSVGLSLGFRAPAAGDYSSRSVAIAAEGRWWFLGRAIFGGHARETDMAGPFLGVRLGLGRTTTEDEIDDERIGDTLTLSETVVIGYRFTPWRGLEVTPTIGAQIRHEFERKNRLANHSAGGATIGATIGWLF